MYFRILATETTFYFVYIVIQRIENCKLITEIPNSVRLSIGFSWNVTLSGYGQCLNFNLWRRLFIISHYNLSWPKFSNFRFVRRMWTHAKLDGNAHRIPHAEWVSDDLWPDATSPLSHSPYLSISLSHCFSHNFMWSSFTRTQIEHCCRSRLHITSSCTSCVCRSIILQ